MTLTELLNNPPTPHRNVDGSVIDQGLIEPALSFVYEHVDRSCTTLETGTGLSTVVFALTGSHHTVIAPAPAEFQIIREYCGTHGIPINHLVFVEAPSQAILPTLTTEPLDLVLIDGGHGFPTPFIDWFYTAGRLKKDGLLVVDDTWLWSCDLLRSFLLEQPEWKLVTEFENRVAVFKKLEDGSEWLEWTRQPRVARGGRMKWIDGRPMVESVTTIVDSTNSSGADSEWLTGRFTGLAGKLKRMLVG